MVFSSTIDSSIASTIASSIASTIDRVRCAHADDAD